MKTALIIHGIGGHAGIHWQRWLHDQLESSGYEVLMPSLSNPDHPDRQIWLTEVKNILKNVDLNNLTIIGHSLGVATALDFIEQNRVNGLVSVSGFAEDYGAELNSYFMKEKPIDFDKIRRNLRWSAVVYGADDPYVTQSALRHLAENLGVEPVIIENGGHINTDTGFTEFPKLLEILE